MYKRLKGTNEQSEFKPLAKLLGEIIYTQGPWHLFQVNSHHGSTPILPEHSPLAAHRFQSPVWTHQLSAPMKACSFCMKAVFPKMVKLNNNFPPTRSGYSYGCP